MQNPMHIGSYELLFQFLQVPTYLRGKHEHDFIIGFLHSIAELRFESEAALKSMAAGMHHASYRTSQLLFSSDSRPDKWYILLSGSVSMDGKLHYPIKCLGRPDSEESRLSGDCYCLEPCDLLVINSSSQQELLSNMLESASVDDSASLNQRVSLDYLFDEAASSVYSDSCCDLDCSSSVQLGDSDTDNEAAAETAAMQGRDSLLSALTKAPNERTVTEAELLHLATRCMPAFAQFNETVQRRLSASLTLASVAPPNAWAVVLDGEVEVTPQSPTATACRLGVGESFDGRLVGQVRPVGADCKLAYLSWDTYLAALGEQDTDDGQDGGRRLVLRKDEMVVLVKEADPSRGGALSVTSGTVAALLDELLSTDAVDGSFAEDFLLTRLAFVSDLALADRLLLALSREPDSGTAWERAERVLLQWVGGHLVDMSDRRLLDRLAQLESRLAGRLGPQHLVRLACTAGAAQRRVTCRRADSLAFLVARDQPSVGGGEVACFVSGLPTVSDAEAVDDINSRLHPLMLGDRVLQSGGLPVDPDRLLYGELGEILDLTVRWDPFHYYRISASLASAAAIQRTISCSPAAHKPPSLPPLPVRQISMPARLVTLDTAASPNGLTRAQMFGAPDRVTIRVHRGGGQCRTLSISRDTPAGVAAALAACQFGVAGSVDYARWQLVEVVAQQQPGPTLRRRVLPDDLTDLVARLPIGGRYFLRRSDEPTDQCLTDEAEAAELAKEASVDLLQLDPRRLAQKLSEIDADAHRRIRPADLVLWWRVGGRSSDATVDSLSAFNRLIRLAEATSSWPGRELATTAQEAESEQQTARRRDRILKRLVRVALECHRLGNLCSATSLALGLAACQTASWDRRLPRRLRAAWLDRLAGLADVSMNHAGYRQQLLAAGQFAVPHPAVLCKDLTSLREAGGGEPELVNFYRLRLVASLARSFCSQRLVPSTPLASPSNSSSSSSSSSSTSSSSSAPSIASPMREARRLASRLLLLGRSSPSPFKFVQRAKFNEAAETLADKQLVDYVQRMVHPGVVCGE